MKTISNWNSVSQEQFTKTTFNQNEVILGYELSGVPDLSSPRFSYLSKEVDNRPIEALKKQMGMLRQLHALGKETGIVFQLLKEKENSLKIRLLFRLNDTMDVKSIDQYIQNSLPSEYSFKSIQDPNVLDVSWAQEVAQIQKKEDEYRGDTYPTGDFQKFYISNLWTNSENTMEQIAQAMLSQTGKILLEIVLRPTQYLSDEQNWINENVFRLRDVMNGEKIQDRHTTLWVGRKLPILKVPLDNYEKLNKQYESSRLFLSEIRVFSESNSQFLAEAFLSSAVKNAGVVQVFRNGFNLFKVIEQAHHNLDISNNLTRYWNLNQDQPYTPYRAQRLNRLVSIEEINNFLRFPLTIRSNFPGFSLDTGLGSFHVAPLKKKIKLGNYLDTPNDQEPAQFDAQQLAKHGLIVGVPGSGKTTAMFNILHQLWQNEIPFIVLEPAKTEYRALKKLDAFKEDLLVFTLGDEGVSPFRFNPMEVLPGIKLENHISRLQSCFVGAFDLFDPLPIFLEQAIRRTYAEAGWYDDSIGGEEGVETPTLSDLVRSADYIIENSGFDPKMKSDFKASLLERLNSLRRGSKGRMLDTKQSIPYEELMAAPIVLELDSLNGDEKSLLMMFLLTYVFEYCKAFRKSGSPIKHLLVVEEAHNLIGNNGGNENRADPSAKAIELFINMLAEMRALGQGILIADQLPTAIAPQAVKQTNVKLLMRVTALDDRQEIGNTMDLNEEQMRNVVYFKTGHAYVFHEGEQTVRMIRMINFKDEHKVEEPPIDSELKNIMAFYEETHLGLYFPFESCSSVCEKCNRRVRNQAQALAEKLFSNPEQDVYAQTMKVKDEATLEKYRKALNLCAISKMGLKQEYDRLLNRYKKVDPKLSGCFFIHLEQIAQDQMKQCAKQNKKCKCTLEERKVKLQEFKKLLKKD